MNTIGNEKLTMSLDDIIASEPLRYTATATRLNVESESPKMHCPKIYGRLQHEPYKQGLLQKNENRQLQQNWNVHGRIAKNRVAPRLKPSPYDHNSFIYNGVHVSENSALLNRRVGQVEIICRPQAEDEYDIEEQEEDEDDGVTHSSQSGPTIGMPVGYPRPGPLLGNSEVTQPRLYKDLNYVRVPVHQRLGWSASDQFRKSRVELAAKFLRKQKNPQNMNKIIRQPDGTFKGVHRQFISKKEMRNRRNMLKAQTMDGNANAMQVSFVNELALDPPPIVQTQTLHQQPRSLLEIKTAVPRQLLQQHQQQQQQRGNFNGGGDAAMFVAPLSRQNVARLPGGERFNVSAASSRVSTMTNEEQILERISSMESIVSKLANSSAISMMSGFLPTMDPTAAMIGQGAVMLPVVGGGMQAYVPLVGGMGAAAVPGPQRYSAFQSHIVQPQEDGGLVVQAVGNVRSVDTPNGRLRRQLIAAANRQPLTQAIQASISAAQAGFRCNNHDRPSREVFAYRPKPHATRCSTNDRIKHYPKPVNANHGRRSKRNN